jgi:hypothetical protein
VHTNLSKLYQLTFAQCVRLFFFLLLFIGLYHGLIPLMNLPFLNASPAPIMFVSRVRDIMGTVPIVWLPQHCHIGELVTLKKRYDKKAGETNRVSHNAFPVVVDPNNLLLQGE